MEHSRVKRNVPDHDCGWSPIAVCICQHSSKYTLAEHKEECNEVEFFKK